MNYKRNMSHELDPNLSYRYFMYIYNLLLIIISLPFLFYITTITVYSGKIKNTSTEIYELLHGETLINYATYLTFFSLLILLCIVCMFWGGHWLAETLRLALYIIISSIYMSFWKFGSGIFANGNSLNIMILLIIILSFPGPNKIAFQKGTFFTLIPLLFVEMIITATFFSAGLNKLLTTGLSWASADNIRNILEYRYLFSGNEIIVTILRNNYLLYLIGPVVLIFELMGWALLIFLKETRWIYGSLCVLFLFLTRFVLGIDEFVFLFLPGLSIYFMPYSSPGIWRAVFRKNSHISIRK
jgi:hypothetical protein